MLKAKFEGVGGPLWLLVVVVVFKLYALHMRLFEDHEGTCVGEEMGG